MEPVLTEMVDLVTRSPETSQAEGAMITLLLAILEELQAIREATETEAVEDAEPDSFQTLNGPAKPKGCGAKLAIEGWGGFCGETDMGQTLPTLCVDCGGPFQTLNGPSQ